MTELTKETPISQFCRAWAESFAHVLAHLGVVSPAVIASEPSPAKALSSEELETTVSVEFAGGGALNGQQIWVADKSTAAQLAQLLLSEATNPAAEFSGTYREAFIELLRQVASHAATMWAKTIGGEAGITFQASSDAVFVPSQSCAVQVSGEKIADLTLRFFVNAALGDSLASLSSEPSMEASKNLPDSALPDNVEILMDVELEATIRFGKREMLLRDIFGLVPGAVVELNQMVNDPAELLVAGRLVARGEVVVVDGNFGLRVSEAVSKRQRAQLIQV
ncbi:MAG TPA: FliM/FliN family flagellar motor switch protein [Candidatus Acidoferrum sp.]|jgi:flagellar motor switch protein FliN/FliY